MFKEKSFYLSQVLGVKSYLCPESIYEVRSLKGQLPCKLLVVTGKVNSNASFDLVDKIMKSIQVNDYTVLEIKNLDYFSSFMNQIDDEKLAKSILIFGENMNHSFNNAHSLQTYSLSSLDGSSAEIQSKKKDLWQQLKKWKQTF